MALRSTWVATALVATCGGPCGEIPPAVGVTNILETTVDVELEADAGAIELHAGERTEFQPYEGAVPDGVLQVWVAGAPDAEVFEFADIVGSAKAGGCYLVKLDSCPAAPDELCPRTVSWQADWPTFNCEETADDE